MTAVEAERPAMLPNLSRSTIAILDTSPAVVRVSHEKDDVGAEAGAGKTEMMAVIHCPAFTNTAQLWDPMP